jgi:hypothetical protein
MSGDDLPLAVRIVTADIFDALTADRPYRAAIQVTNAVATWPTWSGYKSIRCASTRCQRAKRDDARFKA